MWEWRALSLDPLPFANNNAQDQKWISLNDRTVEGDFCCSDGHSLQFENQPPTSPTTSSSAERAAW